MWKKMDKEQRRNHVSKTSQNEQQKKNQIKKEVDDTEGNAAKEQKGTHHAHM